MIHEDTLLPDVRKCEEIIRNARKDSPDTPSDEWLADNYHIVSDAIESLKHLEFKRRAVIAVYNIATEILSRNDGLVREEDVLKVVSFHQNTHPLGSESLVYLCPMLQLAVVKRIADICETTEKSKEPRMLISLGVSMGNAIKSLRSLPTFDWENMLSELNVIEQILRGDPADIYTKMTLKSRKEYIRIVEVCAKRRGITPKEYAIEVIAKAKHNQKHVGELIYEDYTKNNDFGSFFIMFLFTSAILAFCPAVYTFKLSFELYGILGALLGAFCVFLVLIIVMNVALSLIQKMYMDRKVPFSLPELDFSGRLPKNCKIMIVLPCLLSSVKRVDEMVKQLEAAYWANPQEGICYTLLADLPESKTRTTEKDSEIIKYAKAETEKLGEKFRIFIRERTYCKEDDVWMGNERKRGALLELNRAIIDGELPKVDYVLTVDADTVIPINTAVKMAQIMHHPLNRPHVNYVNGEPVVTQGYGILQPAVVSSGLDREKATVFKKIFGEDTGFDSYGCKTSDFYFDVCNEGIYTGKGMYDPYVFNCVLEGRFPKNSILSHDLIEGSFVRTCFVSDIRLYDTFPETYSAYAKREHRWIRGDWQLLPFMGKRFKDERGVLRNSPLNFYSRFKMIMNLLRSLLPVSLFLLFVTGMIFLSRDAFLWFFILFGALLLTAGGGFWHRLTKALSNLVLLPYTFFNNTDAIVRALWRTFRTHKRLLEWVVSSEVNGKVRKRVVKKKVKTLSDAQIKKYRITSRKIWAFYDDYATQNENFLPPDNVQFTPVYAVAHRTSPTNIGFLILSTVIAEHFGYISIEEMICRLENIVNTLDKMKKWNGHIFNWYDTLTLQPLEPVYVSCVDSGNLAACLLASSCIIYEMSSADTSVNAYLVKTVRGLLDTIYCLNDFAAKSDEMPTKLLEDFLKKDNLEENDSTRDEILKITEHYKSIAGYIENERSTPHSYRVKVNELLVKLEKFAKIGNNNNYNYKQRAKTLAKRMEEIALHMNFGVLYDKKRHHLYIGYDYSKGRFSESYYDMLMSEARLTSYVAMAKGDVEAEHFSHLARRYGEDGKVLLSWSGTLFEYVLPELFMPSPYGSALYDSIFEMLKIQMDARAGRPWGVSESGYNDYDDNLNYKYKAFGLKSLAVKRMEGDDNVVAPYASIMASNHLPQNVYENMEKMTKLGVEGKYGYYEAIDYTPGSKGIVESFMAHHVGMALCGMANLLFDSVVSRNFSNMAMMRPVSVMLTEKLPKNTVKTPKRENLIPEKKKNDCEDESFCVSGSDVHVLSNGNYTLVLNGKGNSKSSFCNIGFNVYRDNEMPEGVVSYLNGKVLVPIKCTLHQGCAEYLYMTEREEITQKICVATEHNAEVRQIKITNKSSTEVVENLTIYCRLMLDFPQAYTAHPSYSSMFITTEILARSRDGLCLKATRRKHKPADPHIEGFFCVNFAADTQNLVEAVTYDTDVLSFKGRNTPGNIKADDCPDKPLAEKTGTVLTPCFAVNVKLRLKAAASAEFSYAMGFCANDTGSYAKIKELANVERVFELARMRSKVEEEWEL